jgi:hypothetical protein
LIRRINAGLAELLTRDGLATVADAMGERAGGSGLGRIVQAGAIEK